MNAHMGNMPDGCSTPAAERGEDTKPADRHGKMLSKVVKNQSMLSVFGRVAPRCNTFFGAAETCVDHAFISDIDICTHAETIRTLHLSTDHAMLKLQLRINVLDLPRIPVPRAKCVIRFSLLKEQERRDDYRKKLANLLAEREVASHVFPSTENIQRLKDPVKLEGLCDLITRCITTAAEETLGRSSGRARKVRSRVWNKDLAEAWENVKHLKRVFLADPSQRLQETQFKNARKRFRKQMRLAERRQDLEKFAHEGELLAEGRGREFCGSSQLARERSADPDLRR